MIRRAQPTRQIDDGFGERRFVVGHFGNMSLGRTHLAKKAAGSTLKNAKRLLDIQLLLVVPRRSSTAL